MSKFNTTNRKLKELWEQVEKNNIELKNKDNSEKFNFFTNLLKQQNIKNPFKIFNSSVITLPGTLPTDTVSAFKGENLPRLYTYNETIFLDLPEIFLPFIKYNVEIIPPPNGEIHGVYEYDPSTWSGDNIEVRGDGLLIWKGSLVVKGLGSVYFIVHNESDLLDKGISLSLTKKVWSAIFDDSPANAGKVTRVQGTIITSTNGICVSTKSYNINHAFKKTHRITDLTDTNVVGIGDETITTRTPDGEGGCDTVVVTNTDIPINFPFSAFDGGYTIQTIDLFGILHNVNSIGITKQEFNLDGRWLFWSTDLTNIFSSNTVNIPDGDFLQMQLLNLPSGLPLPYTQITLRRNTAGADLPIRRKQSDGAINNNFTKALAFSTRERQNYFKRSLSTDVIETYSFQLTGSFIVITPATLLSTDPVTFPVYSDTYNPIGSDYFRTENHSLLDKDIWLPTNQDVSLKIKAYLVNPLYWREERKYNKNDI